MNHTSNLRKRVGAIAVAVALLASACGSTADELTEAAEEAAEVVETEETSEDDNAEASDAEAEAEEEPEPEEVDATDDTESDESSTESETEEETVEEEIDQPVENVIPAEYEEFCSVVELIEVQSENIVDPADGFTLISEAYVDLADISPDAQLADDLRLMADVSGQFVEILSNSDPDLLADPSDPILAELEALSTPEVEAAAQNVEQAIGSTCGTGFAGGEVAETLDETIVLDGPGEFAGSMSFGTFDSYEIEVPEGTALTVTMQATDGANVVGIDSLLDVTAPDGESFVNDDFIGATDAGLDTYDSRIEIAEAQAGVYTIEARSFDGQDEGEFLLTVEFG